MSSPLQVMQNCVSAFLHGLMHEKSIPIEIIGKCQMFEYLSRKSEFIQLERYCKSLGLFAKDSTTDNAVKRYTELQLDLKMQEKYQLIESSLEQISDSVSTTLFDGSSHNSTSPCLPRNENFNPLSMSSNNSSIKDMSLVFTNSTFKDPLSNTQPISLLFQQSTNDLRNKEIIQTQPLNIMKGESNYTYQNAAQQPQQFQLNLPLQVLMSNNSTTNNSKIATTSPSQKSYSHRAGSCQINSSSFNSPQERFFVEDLRTHNHQAQKEKQFSLDPKKQTSTDNSSNFLNKHLVNALPHQNTKPGYQANTIKPINFKMTMINAKGYSSFGGLGAQDAGSSQLNKNEFTSPFSQHTSNLNYNQTTGNIIKQNAYNPSSMLSQVKTILHEFKQHTNCLESNNMPSNPSQQQQNYNDLSKQAGGFKTHSVDLQRKSYQLKKLSIYQQTTFTPVQLQQTQY